MCDCECNKAYKNDEYVDIENLSFVKHLVSKLVLECEDEILNATKTFDKRVKCENSNCCIYTNLLVIICLLLLAIICVSYYFIIQNIDQNKTI